MHIIVWLCVPLRSLRSKSIFQELDAIAKRVAEFESPHIGYRNAVGYRAAVCGEFFAPIFEACYAVRDVRTRCAAVNAVFGTEMDLKTIQFEPKSPASLQGIGLWGFGHTEQVAIECTRLIFGTDRNADLNVVCGFDHAKNI